MWLINLFPVLPAKSDFGSTLTDSPVTVLPVFNSKSQVTHEVAAQCSQGLSKPMLMQTRSHTQPLIGQTLDLLSY